MNITSFCRGIVITCLNINSLVAHIDELRIYINSARIDILCVNETKLDFHVFFILFLQQHQRIRIVYENIRHLAFPVSLSPAP